MIPDDALRFFTPPPFPADEDNRQAAVDRLRVERIADDPRLRRSSHGLRLCSTRPQP